MLSMAAPLDEPLKELPAEAQKEVKKFQGKWQLQKEITSTDEQDRSDDPNGVVEFRGRRIVIRGMELLEIASLDLTTDPKCIDFQVLVEVGPYRKGDRVEAVYKIDGDVLTLAIYQGEGSKRPTNLDSPKTPGTTLVTLKRVKQ
jgi:uncharacterized protein (TIGR03067 family)